MPRIATTGTVRRRELLGEGRSLVERAVLGEVTGDQKDVGVTGQLLERGRVAAAKVVGHVHVSDGGDPESTVTVPRHRSASEITPRSSSRPRKARANGLSAVSWSNGGPFDLLAQRSGPPEQRGEVAGVLAEREQAAQQQIRSAA